MKTDELEKPSDVSAGSIDQRNIADGNQCFFFDFLNTDQFHCECTWLYFYVGGLIYAE